jgi:hypothetical protein
MAGRIVILEFDDADAAQVFVDNEDQLKLRGARPIAVFMRPNRFCECPDKQRQHVANWAKGKRTGLYLCKVCKRPSVHHQRGILDRLQYVFGFNQLEVETES